MRPLACAVGNTGTEFDQYLVEGQQTFVSASLPALSMAGIQTQMQIRQNAMEMQEYMKELFDWEQSIKKSEKKGQGPAKPAPPTSAPSEQASIATAAATSSGPAPRGRAAGKVAPAPQELQTPSLTPAQAKALAAAPKTESAAPATAADHTYSSYRCVQIEKDMKHQTTHPSDRGTQKHVHALHQPGMFGHQQNVLDNF